LSSASPPHKVADVYRAGSRNRTEPTAELPDSSIRTDGPEDLMLAAERSERLRALLAHLTKRQREVLVLRVAVGMSAEETAHAVGATTGSVRVTQHRALVRLRQLLQQGEAAAAQHTLDSSVHS
jgi:RNA polymerase sigma-70 factor (ECF subfamily)